MRVTVESKKGLKTNLSVFVDKKDIEKKVDARLMELSKTVNIKGFRPGKVPVKVLKSQFGGNVYAEVLENILKETSTQALDEKKIKPAGQPKLELKSHGEGKDLKYTLEIDALPSIKLKELNSIKFIDYEINITENEKKKRIEDIAKNQNNFIDKEDNEDAKKDDLVIFDYTATIENKTFEGGEGKNTQIVLGKDLFIKGFDKQLLGVKKKEEKIVTVILPQNYPKAEYSNKEAKFTCKVTNIRKATPVKIDDQFAKNLGAKDLKNLEELITKQIQNQYKMSLDALSKEIILNQIEKMHDVDLPKSLVDQELSLISQGLKKEDSEKNKKESEKIAKKRIKLGLILNELGEKNNLKVDENELKSEIQKQAQTMPGQQKEVLDYYTKNPSAIANLRGSIYEEKIIKLIKQQSKATKKTISIKEAEDLIKEQHKHHVHTNEHDHSNDKETKKSKKSKKTKKKSKKSKKIRNK